MQDRRDFIKGVLAMGCLAMAGHLVEGCATLEGRLRNVPSERKLSYDTIAHEVLDIEAGMGVTMADYFVLDEIIDEAKEKITEKPDYTKKEAIAILKTIDKIIDGKGFAKEENLLLNKGLKDKKLDCDNRTIVYLAIADILNLPLKAVNAPRHAFVRWHSGEDKYFNWETMAAEERSDSHYIKKYNLSDVSIKNGALLTSLSRKETYSFAYRIKGIVLDNRKQYWKAIENYNKALEFNPNDPAVHNNKGIALYSLKKYGKALKSLEKALELNPNYALAYSAKGLVLDDSKMYSEALDAYNKSIDLDPKNPLTYNNKGCTLINLGRYREAIHCYDKALELNPGFGAAFRNKELALEKLGRR